MSAVVKLAELVEAYDWVSGGEQFEAEAFVNRLSGEIVLVGVAEDEEETTGLSDEALYVPVPSKRELDLGRSLALRFVRERAPELSPRAHQIFARRGAYSQFKSLLDATGLLGAWYEYEAAAIQEALREWAGENGLVLDDDGKNEG
jgi:hypothetical protein